MKGVTREGEQQTVRGILAVKKGVFFLIIVF
jgi:hypothetical protein